jgi:hypothetical protein
MLLNNGYDIDVIGNVQIESKQQLLCKLKNVTYINGILVRYIVLPQHEFKEFTDQIARQSAELFVTETKLTPTETICYGDLPH